MNQNTSFEINHNLFELVGALFGDGCIKYYRNKRRKYYVIEMYGNPTEDIEYLNYLANILEKITGKIVKPRMKSWRNDEAVVSLCSKSFVEFLVLDLNLICNNKTYTVKIPQKLLRYDWDYLKLLIRGLFDTDGCLFFGRKGCYKKHSYPVLELKIRSHELVDQVEKILKKKGFKARTRNRNEGCRCLYISGKHQLELWMKEICFKNIKHTSKYFVWKKLGYCPPNTTLKERMNLMQR